MKKLFLTLHFLIIPFFMIPTTDVRAGYFADIEEFSTFAASGTPSRSRLLDIFEGIGGARATFALFDETELSASVDELLNSIQETINQVIDQEERSVDIQKIEHKIETALNHYKRSVSKNYKQFLFMVLEEIDNTIQVSSPVESNIINHIKYILFIALKNEINRTNAYGKLYAKTAIRESLDEQESAALTQKEQQTKETDKPLRIGLALSGGGYRAMILTGGYLSGLEEIDLLNNISYISSLSGSSWYLSQWINKKGNTKQLNKELKERFEQKSANLLRNTRVTKDLFSAFINKLWITKMFYNQPISSVDYFALLLEHVLLADERHSPFSYHLSQQAKLIKEHNLPIPLYSALGFDSNNQYTFYEFSPYQVTDLKDNKTIPSWAFGRTFNNGQSTNFAPESPLSFLLALWGSAYTASLNDVLNMFAQDAKATNLSLFQKVMFTIQLKSLSFLNRFLGHKRISPAMIANPFRKNNEPADYLTFVDAGVVANIAVAPLFVKQRAIDIIIVADSSFKNAKRHLDKSTPDLETILEYAKQTYGYEYKREHFFNDHTNHVMPVYIDLKHKEAPIIIYIDFESYEQLFKKIQGNKKYRKLADSIKKYDLENFNIQENHLATFNFDYTPQEFDQLQQIAYFNIVSQAEELKQILKHIQEFKNSRADQSS